MAEQVSRFSTTLENVVVGTAHAGSTKINFEEFAAGAVLITAGQQGTIQWWGAGADVPAGVNQAGASTYPVNTTTGLSGNFAPIVNAAGGQVAQNVGGGAVGQWYPIPAECRPFAALKITSQDITNVAVVLGS
jgi:hypothetical protein